MRFSKAPADFLSRWTVVSMSDSRVSDGRGGTAWTGEAGGSDEERGFPVTIMGEVDLQVQAERESRVEEERWARTQWGGSFGGVLKGIKRP